MEDSKSSKLFEEFYLNCGFATRSVHAGEHIGQPQHASHTGAIYQTSTFVFHNVSEGAAVFSGNQDGYAYTRLGNPTVRLLEAKMNALEGREIKLQNPNLRVSSLAFTSGMAAISSTLMAICTQGDTLLLGNVLYGATQHLAENVLTRFGIKSVDVPTHDLSAVERLVKANPKARAIYLETPTNPTMAITDIAELSRIVKSVNPEIKVIVDNTFATPYLQRPLNLGADVVIHSTTKYLCGHGTVVGGIVTTACDDIKDKAYSIVKDVGGSPSPFDSWLVNLGIKTLPLRMDRHCDNAMAIASYLEKHPKVESIYYPGLESNPYHSLAKKQMSKFGGMISFDIAGGLESGRKLMDNIKVFSLAVSLGCVDSLIQHPASMTHACVPKDKREKGGITDGLVRISVGIEDVEDLITALDEAFKKV